MKCSSKIYVKDLKLAGLRFYSKEDNGLELEKLGYAFLVRLWGNEYVNPFAMGDNYPIFERVPYSNYTRSGEPYGTKVCLINNQDVTGPCYVLENMEFDNVFDSKYIDIETLENYIIESKKFFIDRESIVRERLEKRPFSLELRGILKKDEIKRRELDEFFNERGKQLRKVR